MLSLPTYRAASRPVVVGIGLGLIATTIALAPASADQHISAVELKVTDPSETEIRYTFYDRYNVGRGRDYAIVTDPTPDGGQPLDVMLLDGCDSSGQAWLMGVNPNPDSFQIEVVPPGGQSLIFEIPSAVDQAVPFLFDEAVDCDNVYQPTFEIPTLRGSAKFVGNRKCGSFKTPVSFSESQPGRGYDRFTMGQDQVHRAQRFSPFATTDTSELFDESHVAVALDPEDPSRLTGITVSGREGSMPKTRQRASRIEGSSIFDDPAALSAALTRVEGGKKPNQLLKQLGIKGDPCVYSFEIDLLGTDALTEAEMAVLHAAFSPPLPPVETSDRFRLQVGRGGLRDLDAAPLAGDPVEIGGESSMHFFFAPNDVDALVRVVDGCLLNDHFWVFAAGLSDLEVDLTVTDTQSGEVRQYTAPPGSPFQPITDTEAFSTCP